MAKSYQPLIKHSAKHFISGILAASFISLIFFTALFALWIFAIEHGEQSQIFDRYLWQIISFTFIQAVLSTLLSILFAIIFAKALYQIQFLGKSFLLRLLSITFVLPALVVVTGMITVYGQNGWLAALSQQLNIRLSFSIYGFNGILIAHLFLNFPFASRLCYQSLQQIPTEQRQLAHQLAMSSWQCFRYLELPVLIRQLVPLSGLIFMLCFSSFATVLALGGSPKYATLEVAIYQAVRDFELLFAVVLSLIQLVICLGLMLLLRKLLPKHSPQLLKIAQCYQPKLPFRKKLISYFIVIIGAAFILLPLIAIVFDGIYAFSFQRISSTLIQAMFTSIGVALCSALLALILAVSLLWTNNRLLLFGYSKISQYFMLSGSLILAIPSMVLSTGFFLLFYAMIDSTWLVFLLVVITNCFLSLPFILKYLESPSADLLKQYDLLSQSLGLSSVNYLCFVEFNALKRLYLYCFVLSAIMSMGDFGVIALFGGQDFITLPYYLYEQISHYRLNEANFTALLLLVISFLLISLFDYANKSQLK